MKDIQAALQTVLSDSRDPLDDPEVARLVSEATRAYTEEARNWDPPPGLAAANYQRLRRLVELKAPAVVVENDAKLLLRKVEAMRQQSG